jgi:hypothetical protein
LSKEPYMKKYLWAVIAGVCVLALIVVGAIFIPRLFRAPATEEPIDFVTVMPGHWWKTDLNEQQLKTLQTMWGTDITKAQSSRRTDPTTGKACPSCP